MNNQLYNLVNLEWEYKDILKKGLILNQKITTELNKYQIINILNQFNNDIITLDEIVIWANIIEFNDFIKYEDTLNILNDIICELANPDINWYLTKARAQDIINELNRWKIILG